VSAFADKLRRTLLRGAEREPDAGPRAGPEGVQPAGHPRMPLHRLAEREARVRAGLAEDGLPAGCAVAGEGGSFFLREVAFDLDHRHGDDRLGDVLDASARMLARLAGEPSLAAVAPASALFLDTETTGLAGGVGTVVFMTGMGRVEGSRFVVRQVFMRAFADERAALLRVAAECAAAPALVTFFGKSFDRHRLAARMDLHRIPHALTTHRHLDLYHLHRAVHGKSLPDGRLKTAEQRLLGVRRKDDLPGAFCPLVYLEWLRSGRGPIERIFEHNLIDILSLVTLTARLARDPATCAEPGLLRAHAKRLYRDDPASAAELFERAGAGDDAARARRRAERRSRALAREAGGRRGRRGRGGRVGAAGPAGPVGAAGPAAAAAGSSSVVIRPLEVAVRRRRRAPEGATAELP
jgi:uncharacterized protein YprB with RNaseH-like and TPR domain